MIDKRGAIGILEYSSVPKGIYVLNEVKKRINLQDLHSQILPGGKFMIYMKGSHGNVEYGVELGFSEDTLTDIGWLGSVNFRLEKYLMEDIVRSDSPENLFVFQHSSYAKTLEISNLLLNKLDLEVHLIRADKNMEGSAVAIFSGNLADVREAKNIINTGEMITNIDGEIYEQIRGYYDQDTYFSRG